MERFLRKVGRVLFPVLPVIFCGCTGPMFEGTIFERQYPPRGGAYENAGTIPGRVLQNERDCRQLAAQIEMLSHSLEGVEQRLARLEAAAPRAGAAGEDVAALRRDIQMLRGEHDRMRQEIAADLAARIEKIAARQAAAAAAASAGAEGAGRRPAGRRAAERSGYEHTVERGQTLSEIARGYGTSVRAIMDANKISNPSAIRVGQVLFIPDKER